MKKICLLLAFLIPFVGLKAQENLTPKEEIMQVMQSEEDFLYADQTCTTQEQALERAQAILMREVDAYLKQSGEDSEAVKGTVTEQMVTITVQRGDKYRAFIYINKAVLGTEKKDTFENKAQDSLWIISEDTLVVEIPVVEEIVVQKTDTVQTVDSTVPTAEDDILTQITAMTSRLQVYDFICQLQKDGERISFFEHPKADEQAEMFLVLYKRGGKIDAILTPMDRQGIRYNLATGQPDSKNNHPATSVDGFIYKQ